MHPRAINGFLVLAETLHFARAAEMCHMSASALSRSIMQLEDTVGVRLFERDNRSVRLTAEGIVFRRFARESQRLWEDCRNAMLAGSEELAGEISMYCSVTASYSFLFELLADFRRRHPGIRIKLQTGDPERAAAQVLSGDAEIAIGARPKRLPGALEFRPIATTSLVFVAPLEPAAPSGLSRRAPRGAEWGRVPMIVPERGVARDAIDRWFRRRDVTPRIHAQVAGNEAIVSMVSLGDGIGVVPRIVLENSPLADRVRVMDVRPRLKPLEVGLFVTRRSLSDRLVAAFWTAA